MLDVTLEEEGQTPTLDSATNNDNDDNSSVLFLDMPATTIYLRGGVQAGAELPTPSALHPKSKLAAWPAGSGAGALRSGIHT